MAGRVRGLLSLGRMGIGVRRNGEVGGGGVGS